VLPVAVAHVFVDDLDELALSAEDERHVFRSLRARPGEAITASDGAGRWRQCRVATAGGLAVAGDIALEPRPMPAVTIGFAILKGERPEWVVQKLVELGVDEIVPMTTRHTVVKWTAERGERAVARLRDIARAAAMQSRLAWLPTVAAVTSVADLVARLDRADLAFAHPGGEAPSLERPIVLIGPEGGWSDDELAAAPATVDLGPTNLRGDTAAIAAGVRLCALRTKPPA
jgi:16S rRNA (uracil1498-N3)-methyltransferase